MLTLIDHNAQKHKYYYKMLHFYSAVKLDYWLKIQFDINLIGTFINYSEN